MEQEKELEEAELKGVLGESKEKESLEEKKETGLTYTPVPIKQVVEWALRLKGLPYVFGTEQDGRENPTAEDCSELVQNACDENKVRPSMPDGAINQFYHCRGHGLLISIEKAQETFGALVFRITPPNNHVVFSLGLVNGRGMTFEAKGRAWGVGSWPLNIKGRGWTNAALIPGVDYSKAKVKAKEEKGEEEK